MRQIDGIGGGDSLTSKVVIVGPSTRPGIDIEYLFAQVAVGKGAVDTAPNCGNMLSGVGPFAIARGLVEAGDPTTTIRIFNRNTGKVIEAVVQTPGGEVTYDGDARVDGVPGTGAPIVLNFLDAAGAKTGKLLPTGHARDIMEGIDVSCVDLSSPLVFVRATDLGKTGYETKRELDADPASDRPHRVHAPQGSPVDGDGRRRRQGAAKVCAGRAARSQRYACRTVLRAVELPLRVRRHRRAVPGRCGDGFRDP